MGTDLTLRDVIDRTSPPRPWAEGDNIPWDDPDFSARMLREHLSQEHDLASRRNGLVEEHLQWLDRTIMRRRPGRVLDLACGPGFYLHGLCRRGHRGTGIDFGPAAIGYARSIAGEQGLDCRFVRADLRSAELDAGYDLVLLIYGQVNVFRREQAREILSRAFGALDPGGQLVLEPQTFACVHGTGRTEIDWSTAASGLFSEQPHLLLHEVFWDERSRTRTERWHVVDATTGRVQRHAMSVVAWEQHELVDLLGEIGFTSVETTPSLTGVAAPADDPMYGIVASRT